MTKRFPLTRAEKESKVIELIEKGVNIRDIAKRVHMSFTDIGNITRKHFGDDGVSRSKKYTKHSQALQLFQRGKTKLEVATELGLTDSETIAEYKQFMVLNGFDRFCEFYDEMAGDMGPYLSLYQELKLACVSVRDAIEGVKLVPQLNQLKFERDGLLREVLKLKGEIHNSSKELDALKRQKNSVLGILEEGKAVVWNEIAKNEYRNPPLTWEDEENGLDIRKSCKVSISAFNTFDRKVE